MPYLPTAVLALAGLVLLVLTLVRLVNGLGRVRAVLGTAKASFSDETGLLKARSAALRVAIAERKRSAGRVPSTRRMQTGGRP
ncbi:bacteriophage holin [Actinokineospora sp. HUAS TT18]|uniref:bacteriophage holin n=1 Tax=Actinokineospora sp. HUAS TT18 TaxID=3447451 RepID=UPI003F525241